VGFHVERRTRTVAVVVVVIDVLRHRAADPQSREVRSDAPDGTPAGSSLQRYEPDLSNYLIALQ
jgi:hypothetical protein